MLPTVSDVWHTTSSTTESCLVCHKHYIEPCRESTLQNSQHASSPHVLMESRRCTVICAEAMCYYTQSASCTAIVLHESNLVPNYTAHSNHAPCAMLWSQVDALWKVTLASTLLPPVIGQTNYCRGTHRQGNCLHWTYQWPSPLHTFMNYCTWLKKRRINDGGLTLSSIQHWLLTSHGWTACPLVV